MSYQECTSWKRTLSEHISNIYVKNKKISGNSLIGPNFLGGGA